MQIADSPKVSRADLKLLCRLLAAEPIRVPASALGDDLDLIPDLQALGYVLVWDEDHENPEPRVMLSPVFAGKAGYETAGDFAEWTPIRPLLPETAARAAKEARRKRVRLIPETDVMAGARRRGETGPSPVEAAVAAAMPPADDGPHRRPTSLVGLSRIWDGPDTGNPAGRPDRICSVCGTAAELPGGSACLKCCRMAGERATHPRRRKRKEVA